LKDDYDDGLEGNIGKFFSVLHNFWDENERGKWEGSLGVLNGLS